MFAIDLFNKEFTILEGLFNRQFPDAVRDRYYRVISAELDDEQFRAACLNVFKNETRFPTPARMIELAPSTESMICGELERLGLDGTLHPGFNHPANLISELKPSEQRNYLAYLRNLEERHALRAG